MKRVIVVFRDPERGSSHIPGVTGSGFASPQVINGGLLLGASGAALGVCCFLLKNPPDVNRLLGAAERLWSRLTALRTP